jgi:tetratricopeptide (TPR) repeat protein
MHIKRSVEFFYTALHNQPNNIRAASGIAIAYALSGLFEESKDIFNQLQGVSPLDLDIVLNAAHVLVSTNQHQPAISLYESLLRKSRTAHNADILTALARTHYIIAKTDMDPDSMKKAEKFVSDAMISEPNNDKHLFNHALIMQQYAYILVFFGVFMVEPTTARETSSKIY